MVAQNTFGQENNQSDPGEE